MCYGMKPTAMVYNIKADYFPSMPRKDLSIGVMKLVSVLVVFMAGVVLGLALSANFYRYYTSQTELFFPRKMYTATCDNDCSSFENFIRPPHLMHSMTDEELFWRASMVPKMEEYPFERVPKVAFLFLTRGPLPFAPLWERFFKDHKGLYSIYIHTLPNYKLNVTETSVFYGRQIPSEVRFANLFNYLKFNHYSFSLGDFLLIRLACSSTISYSLIRVANAEKYILLSGKWFACLY